MIETIKKPYSYTFENFAKKDKKILCLSGDLTSSCEVDSFRDNYPDIAYLFAWNHKKEIFEKEKEFKSKNGKWISHIDL